MPPQAPMPTSGAARLTVSATCGPSKAPARSALPATKGGGGDQAAGEEPGRHRQQGRRQRPRAEREAEPPARGCDDGVHAATARGLACAPAISSSHPSLVDLRRCELGVDDRSEDAIGVLAQHRRGLALGAHRVGKGLVAAGMRRR